MATETSPSKVDRIAALLRRELEDGRYPESSLFPSQNELVDRFQVANHTVRAAVSHLVAEGYLAKVQGRGTFVKSTSARAGGVDTASAMVGLVMRTHGHVFADLFHRLSGQLSDRGFLPTVFDTTPNDDMTIPEARRWAFDKLQGLVRRGVRRFVIDGDLRMPLQRLAELPYESIVFVHRYESTVDLPRCSKVLSDYAEGGRVAAAHLLARGHRRIALALFAPVEENNIGTDFVGGAHKACVESGLDPNAVFIPAMDETDETREAHLTDMLASPGRPTAVLSLGDFRLACVYEIARQRGIRIPEDLSLVGYYDTHWCRAYHPRLTSVSLRETEMAACFEQALTHTGIQITVKPVLVERDSVAQFQGQMA